MITREEARVLAVIAVWVFIGAIITIVGASWFFAGMCYGIIGTMALTYYLFLFKGGKW